MCWRVNLSIYYKFVAIGAFEDIMKPRKFSCNGDDVCKAGVKCDWWDYGTFKYVLQIRSVDWLT